MAEQRLRKTLPKDLKTLLAASRESDDYAAVHTALEACLPDARGGYAKGTALHLPECTPELAGWLVARGTDVNAEDRHGKTALYDSAFARSHHHLPPADLIRLGADVHHTTSEGLTPLHFAADGKNLAAVKALLEHGADARCTSTRGLTPLGYALERLSNAGITALAPVAETLLRAGDTTSETMRGLLSKTVRNFEFHRESFSQDHVEETDAGLTTLCELLAFKRPKGRRKHDGYSTIAPPPGEWQAQHRELWDLLVPSSGPCRTVQGEVIRITGRIADERHRNGGVNWGRDDLEMLGALLEHMASHQKLDAAMLEEAKHLAAIVRKQPDPTTDRLMELAVHWVARNPTPHKLGTPGDSR